MFFYTMFIAQIGFRMETNEGCQAKVTVTNIWPFSPNKFAKQTVAL